MADTKPATERQKYLDEKIAEAEGAAANADRTLQERDSKAAQEKEHTEKKGTGEASHDSVKAAKLAMLRQKASALRSAGATEALNKVLAEISALENSE